MNTPILFNKTNGHFHFIGIGGIGMSGLAQLLYAWGYSVSGSDTRESDMVMYLKAQGVTDVKIPQQAENIHPHFDYVVLSSAIKPDNPERLAAEKAGKTMLHRADMLAEILKHFQGITICGTHGKTTTTAMVGHMLTSGSLDPSILNGGMIQSLGSNVRIGHSPWFVAEADESDKTMILYQSSYAIVTNIDPEHMENYGNENCLHQTFTTYMNQASKGVAACIDHPVVKKLCKNITSPVITYGFDETAQIYGYNVRPMQTGSLFSVRIHGSIFEDVYLSTPGRHNVQNALASIAIAHEVGISEDSIRQALSTFSGVARRFTVTGVTRQNVTIIDDYAHHPVEIDALIAMAKQANPEGRVIALFQPHKFSRLKDHLDGFAQSLKNADTVWLAPVYAAGENPNGVDIYDLSKKLGGATVFETYEACVPVASKNLKSGDMLLCIGAGDITQWAYRLPEQLDAAC